MWKIQAMFRQVFLKSQQNLYNYKFYLFLVLSLFFSPLNAQAGEVILAWDPPATEYEGFILSYGTSSGSYSENQDVGSKTTYTVSNLDEGQTYFFAVKAYNNSYNEESPYSKQVSVTVPAMDVTPPNSPRSVQIISGS